MIRTPWRPQLPTDFFTKLVMLRKMMIEYADVEMKVVIAINRQDLPRKEIVVVRLAIAANPINFHSSPANMSKPM